MVVESQFSIAYMIPYVWYLGIVDKDVVVYPGHILSGKEFRY